MNILLATAMFALATATFAHAHDGLSFGAKTADKSENEQKQDQPQTRTLTFLLLLWERQPGSVPQRILPEITVELTIDRPAGPGLMQVARRAWKEQQAEGELQVAWAYPQASSGWPEYFNIQLTINHPYRAQCAMTPKVDDEGVPSLVCNQWPADPKHDPQLGATLVDKRILPKQ